MKQTFSACGREVPNTAATHSYSSRTDNCIHFVNFKVFINNSINISLELSYFLLSMEGSGLTWGSWRWYSSCPKSWVDNGSYPASFAETCTVVPGSPEQRKASLTGSVRTYPILTHPGVGI